MDGRAQQGRQPRPCLPCPERPSVQQWEGAEAGGAPIMDRFWSIIKYSRPRIGYASVWSARPGQLALGGVAPSIARAAAASPICQRPRGARTVCNNNGPIRAQGVGREAAAGSNRAVRPAWCRSAAPARAGHQARAPAPAPAGGGHGGAGRVRAHWTRRPRCRPSRRPRRSGPTRRPARPCRSAPGPAAGSCPPRWRPPPAPGPRSSPGQLHIPARRADGQRRHTLI